MSGMILVFKVWFCALLKIKCREAWVEEKDFLGGIDIVTVRGTLVQCDSSRGDGKTSDSRCICKV